MDVRLKDRHAHYLLHGALNKDSRMHVAGEARLKLDTILCTIDGFDASYRDFRWEAESGAQMKIGSDYITLEGLSLNRGDARVDVAGKIAQKGALAATVHGTSLNLEDLRYLLSGCGTIVGRTRVRGDARCGHDARRNDSPHPTFSAKIAADSIALRGIPFGSIRGTVGYGNSVLDLSIARGCHARARR